LNLTTSLIIEGNDHNGFPDLIHWRGNFYLAFRVAKNHIDPHSTIKIYASSDTQSWIPLAELRLDDQDIRDPKFAVIGDQLFLYALRTRSKTLDAMPYTTIFCTSRDGAIWTPWQGISPANWVFWRPKTNDGTRWYVAADDRKRKRSALFTSLDGINWDKVSSIHSGEFHAEIELAFLANQDLLCTIRVEGTEGRPRTLLGHAGHPYRAWHLASNHLTRLDGAVSFIYRGQVFSVGRFEPNPLFKMGHYLNQKRTALFCSNAHNLVWLADLPSSGDTGYAAVVTLGDTAFVAYYTSAPDTNYPWLVGQFRPTQIRLARIHLPDLARLTAQT